MRYPKWARAAGVFAAALLIRVIFLRQWSHTPFYLTPQLDDQIYVLWAQNILAGAWVGEGAFFQSPLYPYLMAAVFKCVGFKPAFILWLQVFAGAAAAPLILWISHRLFGQRAGLFAGLFAAFYAPFIFYGVFFLKETWLILGLSAFLLLFLRGEESGRRRDGFWCGLVLGACALLKGNSLLLAAVPAVLWRPVKGKGPAKPLRAFAVGLILALLPTVIHNAVTSRDFVLINYNTGFSLYMGNNASATGTMSLPFGISAHPLLEETQSAVVAKARTGKDLSPSQISRYWFKEALRYSVKNPGQWAKRTVLKAYLFLNRYELPDNYDMKFLSRNFKTVLALPLPGFGAAASLTLFALLLLPWGGREGKAVLALFLLYALSVIGTSVTGRYRLPALVFLIPFVGAALDFLLTPGVAKAMKRRGAALTGMAVILVLVHYPWPRYTENDKARGWALVSQAFYERDRYREALVAFTTALDAAPAAVGEAAFLGAGSSAEHLGETQSARLIYATGTQVHPRSGVLHRRMNRLDSTGPPRVP